MNNAAEKLSPRMVKTGRSRLPATVAARDTFDTSGPRVNGAVGQKIDVKVIFERT